MTERHFNVFTMRLTFLGSVWASSLERAQSQAESKWPERSGLILEDVQANQRRADNEQHSADWL